jgi:hypothetical protein
VISFLQFFSTNLYKNFCCFQCVSRVFLPIRTLFNSVIIIFCTEITTSCHGTTDPIRSKYPRYVMSIWAVARTYDEFTTSSSGFGVLACWPLLPKIAGSLPAEAVGFFGRKSPQHAFLRKGSKAVCPMSQICGMSKNPIIYRGSRTL